MEIRPIKGNDAASFLELCKKVDESGYMMFEPGERQLTIDQQRKAIERIQAEDQTCFYVAEVKNKLVGYIAAIGGSLKRNQHSAYLVMGVLADYQGQGIATRLLQEIMEWAKNKGMTRLELTVIKNNTKAIHLYQKLGFSLEGEKVNSLMINGHPMNEYYMYKLL